MEVDKWESGLIHVGESLSVVAGDDGYCEPICLWKGMCGQVRRLQVVHEQADIVSIVDGL